MCPVSISARAGVDIHVHAYGTLGFANPDTVGALSTCALTRMSTEGFIVHPLAAYSHGYDRVWLSGPPGRLFLGDGVFQDVLPSLLRVLGGWGLAVAMGVPLGILIGRSRNLSDFVNPTLQFLCNPRTRVDFGFHHPAWNRIYNARYVDRVWISLADPVEYDRGHSDH